jgi:hypothetical protein
MLRSASNIKHMALLVLVGLFSIISMMAQAQQFCQDNKYSTAGQSSCSICPDNMFTAGGTLTTRTSCNVCPGGYSCNGGSVISVCPEGTASSTGEGSCSLLDVDVELPDDGQTPIAVSEPSILILMFSGLAALFVARRVRVSKTKSRNS